MYFLGDDSVSAKAENQTNIKKQSEDTSTNSTTVN